VGAGEKRRTETSLFFNDKFFEGSASVNQYSQTVLDALLSAVDNQEEAVALEVGGFFLPSLCFLLKKTLPKAMTGLARVFDLVEESRVAPVLVNLCNRVRPSFENSNPKMRAAAFTLFGTLWHFGQKSARDVFYAQIHANLALLLLHVNDESADVKVLDSSAFFFLWL
jgi:hypothetical protein